MRDEAQLREEPPSARGSHTVAWVTALCMLGAAGIFGMGFVIGGRMARLDIAHEPLIDPIARLDVQRKLHDELTFYDDLTAKQKSRPAQAPQAAAAPAAQVPASAKPAAPQTAPTPSRQAPSPATGSKPSVAQAARPVVAAPAPVAADPGKATPPKYQGLLGLHDGPARAGEFTVQVSSYQSHEEARAFCGQLERKGFRPFVVKTDLGLRGTWYRVRVGRFLDENRAKQAKQTLAQADIASWILRTE